MAISEVNIKLMASQRLSDTDDGGGRMTGIEVIDGNVNNLFPDISRLDRVYGKVSLRKAFVSVDTADQDTYSGAHLILTNPTADPLVSVCLFTTSNPVDLRLAAQDRIESYVTQGPKYFGWLWGNQLAGSRALLFFLPPDAAPPDVGDVMFLVEDEGAPGEFSQYVRITDVTTSTITATVGSASTVRKTVTVGIGEPLRHTFHGGELSNNDAIVYPAVPYTTIVADAAKYYGCMRLKIAVAKGDISVSVASIYNHLVPSAQSEAPLIDLVPGEAGPVKNSGASRTITFPGFVAGDGAQFYFGRGMAPGSVSVNGVISYTDSGSGVLLDGTTVSGTIDYGLGVITWVGQTSWTGTCSVTANIATSVPRISNSTLQVVDINNRGYNYTRIISPPPMPGTLTVDYMAQGRWYRLRDNGLGELVPDIVNTGTGTINYLTGSIITTCAALPDTDSAILYGWGAPVEVEKSVGLITVTMPQVVHTLADAPVAPGSVVITWPNPTGISTVVDANTAATAAGLGTLSGDGTGTINYATGECIWRPLVLPAVGASFSYDYLRYGKIQETPSVAVAAGIATVTLTQTPVQSGSLSLLMGVTLRGKVHIYSITDDGAGNMAAPGWSHGHPLSWPEWDGTTEIQGLSGAIDLVTGVVTMDLSALSVNEITYVPTTTLVDTY